MPEFAVGYSSRKNYGEPFAPLTEEAARRALPSLRRYWADAILITRDHPAEPWRRAEPTGE